MGIAVRSFCMSASILVTAKVNPDLDGVACAHAYSHLLSRQGKNATGGVFGQMHAEAAYLVDRFGINVVHDPAGSFDSFVLVDASDMAGMPPVIRPEAVVEVIDHREVHRAGEVFLNAEIQIERVGSAATLVVERYRSLHQPIDVHSAILLYTAIYSNTLNFQVFIANERDKIAANWLQSQTTIPPHLVDDMFAAKTKFAFENLKDALMIDAKQLTIGVHRIGIAQLEILDLQRLAETRLDDILVILQDLKKEHRLDAILLTAVDLNDDFNLFITPDATMKAALAQALHIDFEGNIAKRAGVLLRKQLIPLLKAVTEGSDAQR